MVSSRQIVCSTPSVLACFKISDLLYSFTNPHIVNLVKKVIRQADNYRSAISISVVTAEDGHAFANDAIILCKKLAQGTEPVQHLLSFVDSMQKIAEKSYHAADQTNKQFRAIRVEIGKVSRAFDLYLIAYQSAV